MKSLIVYFGCGNITVVVYQVSKFSDIYDKIIPFLYLKKPNSRCKAYGLP
jgi:hypothetical protein